MSLDLLMKWPIEDASLPVLVDMLGMLRAELAPLKKREEQLKLAIIETGERTAVGVKLYDAAVSFGTRVTLDRERVEEVFGIEQLDEHDCYKESNVVQVRLYAKGSVRPKKRSRAA